MNITFDAAGGGPADRLDRRDAGARQERWALEVDRALFAAAAPRQAPERASASLAQPEDRPMRQPAGPRLPFESAVHPDVRESVAPHGGARQEGEPSAEEPAGELRDEAGELRGASAPRPGESMAQAADHSREAAHRSPEAAHRSRTGAPEATAIDVPMQKQVTGTGFVSSGPAVPGAAAGLPAAGVTAGLAVRAPDRGFAAAAIPPAQAALQGPAELSAAPLAQAADAQLPSQAMGAEEAMFGEAPAGAETEEAGMHRGGHPGGTDDTSEYAKRVLHIYRQHDEVKASIRDAELGQLQARAVAQALASQLASQGVRLRELTVNGKPVMASPGNAIRTGDEAAAEDRARNEYDIPAPFKENNKYGH